MTDDKQLRKKVILNVPYILIGLFGTKVGQAIRFADGNDISEKFLNLLDGFQLAFESMAPSFFLQDILIGTAIALAIRMAVYMKGKNQKKYRRNEEYGSARWGTEADIKPFEDQLFGNNLILTQTERLTMSSRPPLPKNARNKNVLVIGGSGSGKTRFFVKPNILQAGMKTNYPISLVCTDPKGELIWSTGKLMKQCGYKVRTFNTIDFSKSMHYNPFAYIKCEKDILKLVTTLINNTKGDGKAGDDFWVKAETLLYCALIGYLFYEAIPENQNFGTLLTMLNNMETREDDENYKNVVDLVFEELEANDPDHFAVRQYKRFKLAAGKTVKSILISCAARLAPFDIKEVREITRYDDLELDMIGERKTALYLVMSDNDPTFNFLIAMIYTQLFNSLVEKADNEHKGSLPVHVRCLIDEAANIGQIPNLEKLMATIRSREISACLIWQTQAQIKAIYKENSETIIGNCDSRLFLGGSEPTTLKDLSESLGQETIDTFNTGESRGVQTSHSLNYQKLGKRLLSTDELAVLDGGKCILQLRGVRPFLSDKYDITSHPNYRYLSDYDERNGFDVSECLSVEAHLSPEDVMELFEIKLKDG